MATIPASENQFPSLLFVEAAAPATPGTGLIIAYAKAGGVFAWKDDAGVEHIVGEGDTAAHLADATDAHDASAISFTPAGTIAATDVQAAIEEVASEAGGGASPTSGALTATVATSQSTTTTSYVDLGTVGPAVTITVNTMALVIVRCRNNGGAGSYGRMSWAASSANTIAAADSSACGLGEGAYDGVSEASTLLTGLTPGSTVFTAKYKNIDGAPTTNFADRVITVIPLD